MVGCGTLVRDPHSWSPHVGEIRMVVSPDVRGQGVGRALSQETFALALGAGLEKLSVQMTVDQQAAIALFESLGFKAEALLRDHVRDVDGKKHDIVVLGHNVAQVRAQMEAYGLPGAVAHLIGRTIRRFPGKSPNNPADHEFVISQCNIDVASHH